MSDLSIGTPLDSQQSLERLLQKRAEIAEIKRQNASEEALIEAQIASLSLPAPSHLHRSHSGVHKQYQQSQRRGHSRSLSINGPAIHMGRSHSDIPIQRQRNHSQRSEGSLSMARTNSKGSASQRSIPFSSNGPPPPLFSSESRRDTPAMASWDLQEQPFHTQNLVHQPPSLQRSKSQMTSGLPQVPESLGDLEDPTSFISRISQEFGNPTLSIPPTPIAYSPHRLSISSQYPPTPSTTTSDALTFGTTITSNMSRQNSVNDYMLDGVKMMNVDSSTSYSQNTFYDQTSDQFSPQFPLTRHSSTEDQAHLLTGAGGASIESEFSLPFPLPSSDLSGEKMDRSNKSSSSSSSSSSRNVQRLQNQNEAAKRRALKPKEDNTMSRENSSSSMTRNESKDGSSDKVSITKSTYKRPQHEKVYCKKCDSHPEGFRGEHELRRHAEREHKKIVKKWVCEEPADSTARLRPILPLSKCKACQLQKKKYGAYYNAAAHLRRAHFKPKAKSSPRPKNNAKDEGEKRGGKGGGDWPPMSELKHWMKEVEEQVTLAELEQQQAQEAAEDEEAAAAYEFDESPFSQQSISTMSITSLDNFLDSPQHSYPPNIDINMFNTQNMVDLSGASCMEQPMYTLASQSSFHTFSPNHSNFPADVTMPFDQSLLSQLEEQILSAPDFVNHPYYQ